MVGPGNWILAIQGMYMYVFFFLFLHPQFPVSKVINGPLAEQINFFISYLGRRAGTALTLVALVQHGEP